MKTNLRCNLSPSRSSQRLSCSIILLHKMLWVTTYWLHQTGQVNPILATPDALGQPHTGYTRRARSTTQWLHQTRWVNHILATSDMRGQPHTGNTRRPGSTTYWLHQMRWVNHILATPDALGQQHPGYTMDTLVRVNPCTGLDDATIGLMCEQRN